jgi:hypothetical protein
MTHEVDQPTLSGAAATPPTATTCRYGHRRDADMDAAHEALRAALARPAGRTESFRDELVVSRYRLARAITAALAGSSVRVCEYDEYLDRRGAVFVEQPDGTYSRLSRRKFARLVQRIVGDIEPDVFASRLRPLIERTVRVIGHELENDQSPFLLDVVDYVADDLFDTGAPHVADRAKADAANERDAKKRGQRQSALCRARRAARTAARDDHVHRFVSSLPLSSWVRTADLLAAYTDSATAHDIEDPLGRNRFLAVCRDRTDVLRASRRHHGRGFVITPTTDRDAERVHVPGWFTAGAVDQ